MKKLRIAALVLTVMMIFLGCSTKPAQNAQNDKQSAQETPQYTPWPTPDPNFNPVTQTVGFVMSGKQDLFTRCAQHGFLRQAESLGYVAKLFLSGEEGQIDAMIQEAIDNQCSGVLIWAEGDEFERVAQKAKAAGVKVVAPYFEIQSLANADANLAASTMDYTQEAARIMCEEIINRKKTEGVILIANNADEGIGEEFKLSVDKEYPQFNVEFYDGTTPVVEMTKVRADIVGILALAQDSAESWVNACKTAQDELKPTATPAAAATEQPQNTASPSAQAETTPKATTEDSYKRNPVIVALDYSEMNIKLVKNSSIYALIARPYYDSTAQSMFVLDRILRNIPTQSVVRINAPIIRKAGINKYDKLVQEVCEWFDI